MGQSEKEKVVRRLQEDSLDIIRTPEVISRLGHYATKLADAVERAEFVDVDTDGFLNINSLKKSAIPVSALHIGERAILRASDVHMNTRQVEVLAKKHDDYLVSLTYDDLFPRFTDEQFLSRPPAFDEKQPERLAKTSTTEWVVDDTVIIWGRPHASMNMVYRVNDKFSPIIFLHEMTHVLQREATPVQEIYGYELKMIRRELEAYYVATQIIMGYEDAGRQAELLEHTAEKEINYARVIEEVRSSYETDGDPFRPNAKIVKGLVDNQLAITKDIAEFIDDDQR